MAKNIYKNLKCGPPQSPDSHYEGFTAGMGLFENFKADLSVSINRHHQVLFTPTHALFHTTMYQSFKLY